MKLTLDHTQRLNRHALLDAQRADVGSSRAIWAIQDGLALDTDEEKAVLAAELPVPHALGVLLEVLLSVPIYTLRIVTQTWGIQPSFLMSRPPKNSKLVLCLGK